MSLSVCLYVSVSMSLSLCLCLSDTIKGATKEGGYAAAKREVKKITKYNSELLHDGSKPHMIPLVFEHFGHWGSEGEKFLHYIAKLSRNDQGKKNEADFCRYWRRRFSVSLQKCNSRVI